MVDERKHKHLEFIQAVINRLSMNSFLLKGWGVTLVSALLILSARYGQVELVRLTLIPAIMFWALDGYFLWQERLYRNLYNCVRNLKDCDINFSMDARQPRRSDAPRYLGAVISKTLMIFHGTLVFLVVALALCPSLITRG